MAAQGFTGFLSNARVAVDLFWALLSSANYAAGALASNAALRPAAQASAPTGNSLFPSVT
jgi:hypothetical protein